MSVSIQQRAITPSVERVARLGRAGIPTKLAVVVSSGRRRGVCSASEDANNLTASGKDESAILARIAKAKTYRQTSSAEEQEEKGEEVVQARFDAYADALAESETAAFLRAQEESVGVEEQRGRPEVYIERGFGAGKDVVSDSSSSRQGSGDSTEAAQWLPSASEARSSTIDSSLRAEEFTIEKEKQYRQQDVVIERAKGVVAGTNRKETQVDDYGIAQQFQDAELSMAKEREAARERTLEQEEEADTGNGLHKPKVATWGVFPRPENISKTYGGGRNIKPGQVLETKEEAEARGKRVSEALAQYRKTAGLDIDPVVEEKATLLYEKGEELFKSGSISAAMEQYAAAADMVPLKSKIGGLATFQKAVCLDSLGRNEEAYPIYKSLKGHTAPGVAKNSKRMLFGFQAAKDLKVDTMGKFNDGAVDQWRGYFDRATDSTWTVYKQKEGESEEDAIEERKTALFATAVMLLPIILVTIAIQK